MTALFYILLLLFIKHYICDYILQTERMVASKGNYGEITGITHSAEHATGTAIVLLLLLPYDIGAHIVAIVIALMDGVLHYHIDWAKAKLSNGLGVMDKAFWGWFGLDQLLHTLTYMGIAFLLFLV